MLSHGAGQARVKADIGTDIDKNRRIGQKATDAGYLFRFMISLLHRRIPDQPEAERRPGTNQALQAEFPSESGSSRPEGAPVHYSQQSMQHIHGKPGPYLVKCNDIQALHCKSHSLGRSGIGLFSRPHPVPERDSRYRKYAPSPSVEHDSRGCWNDSCKFMDDLCLL
jgi:hypothetical protein